jgi:SAM-dependent methyltransferase
MPDDYALALSDMELQRYALMARMARESESELWSQAGMVPGASVGDIGCGPGALFAALVDAVGDGGRVRGVDGDPAAVAQARSAVVSAGWTNVEVSQGRADDTGLEPGSLDVVMMRHVLAHNGPGERGIVEHLATLVRPGGHVYLVDIDATLFRMQPEHPDVEDLNATYRRFHADKGNDLQVGLRLPELVEAAGLEIVDYRGWFSILQPPSHVRPPAWAAREAMVASGHATGEDVARWEHAFEELAPQRPRVFAPFFGIVARRPD